MKAPTSLSSGRKDLQDLARLPRAPVLSYGQKQVRPIAPRPKISGLKPRRYPLLAAFSPTRLWKWITQYLSHRFGRRHPFLDYSATGADKGVYRLADDDGVVRIALAGDWASGTDEAHAIGRLICAFKPHYSVHLGDVYYVGDLEEVDENFLGIKNPSNHYQPCDWPRGSQGTFALNGNHEMYALGYAYFDQILPKLGLVADGRSQGQRASFFCLENDHWRIIALDTGYSSIGWPMVEYIFSPSCALRPEIITWLRETVQPRNDDPRGIILLSHHEYFSRFDACFPKPARQLASFFARPVLWFWGHEHRLAIYEETSMPGGIRAFGRCIGHGGMPVELSPCKPKHPEYRVEFVDDRHYPNDENLAIGFNGFARMTLRGNRAALNYVDIHDSVVFAETWEVNGGVLRRGQGAPGTGIGGAAIV